MRNRPLKRISNPGSNTVQSVSSAPDRWQSDLPETVQQCFQNQNGDDFDGWKSRKRIRRKSRLPYFWIHSSLMKYHIPVLPLVTFTTFVCFGVFLMNYSIQDHPKWIHKTYSNKTLHKFRSKIKTIGREVSPLTEGFLLAFTNAKWASRRLNSDFHESAELEPFGYHRLKDSKTRSYGGLDIKFLEDEKNRMRRREIYHDFQVDRGYDDLSPANQDDDDYHDYYYAFDDDVKRNPLNAWNDDKIQDEKLCRRTSWHRDLPINCNTMHEFDVLGRFADGGTKYLGAGAYREVYLSETPEGIKVAYKAYYWKAKFKYDDFEFMRMDAIVAERLTWSPRIVNIYGFCGTGMINEAMVNGDLEAIAIPKGGRLENGEELNDKEHLDPRNDLTADQKLKYALDMVESVVLLHGFPDGVIVHDDIQLAQYLLDEHGNLKLNDFNRAEIMLFNEKDQEYCRYRNNPGHGDVSIIICCRSLAMACLINMCLFLERDAQWRAPEEYKDEPLDESIDVWSLGNNMYALLTGLSPLYHIDDVHVVQKKIVKGETGYIDPRYETRSFAEGELAKIIKLCWSYKPSNRPNIFQLADLLRAAHKKNLDLQQKRL